MPDRIRWAAVALVLSGIMFVLFPVARPFFDESSMQGAREFAATVWPLAHSFGIPGFILLAPGIIFIATGLLLVGVAAIVLASAVWVSGTLPKWSRVLFAIGCVFYILIAACVPLFQPIRIIDPRVIAIGCSWIAWGMWKEVPVRH